MTLAPHPGAAPGERRAQPGGLAVLVLLGACGFHATAIPADQDPAPAPDAQLDGSPGATPAPFCDPADLHLVVCYELDGNTRDGSSHHLDATMTNVTFVAGKVGTAMLVGPTSAADVVNSAAFDVTALTIEAWIWPAQLPPTGARAGILDMESQYGFFLQPGGELACTMSGGPSIPATAAHIATDRWTHVACTYDGSTTTAMYVDGVRIASAAGGGTLATGGNSGISLAANNPPTVTPRSQLIGLIDEIRMMDVARTPDQICADAGRVSCAVAAAR
jgi:concanavalin A-like lectin/glucanase superfamily protein